MEEWRPVVGMKEYEVSSIGRVRSWKIWGGRNGMYRGVRSKKFRLLTQHLDNKGYFQVKVNGFARHVHRLVATAFIPNPEGKRNVHHRDEDGANNCVGNLFWATAEEHRKEHLRILLKTDSAGMGGKLSPSEVRDVRKRGKEGVPKTAKMFGVSPTTIYNILANKSYQWVR